MTDPLLSLSDADLAEVGRALRAGRLDAPFSGIGLQRVLPESAATGVAAALQRFAEQGFTREQIATVAELVGRSRGQRKVAEDLFDLVVTGPEAPGIANRDTSVVVREMFSHAERSVLLAGYAVYQGQKVFQALAERMEARPNLSVRFFLDVGRGPGDTSASDQIIRRFAERFRTKHWPQGHRHPEVYFDPRSLETDASKKACLHAKCIVADREQVFISSANFTEAAQERNLEVGLLIRSAHLATRLADHFEALVSHRLLERLL